MSDYVRAKVIRYPILSDLDYEEIEEEFCKKEDFYDGNKKNKFRLEYSDTYTAFLDYVLNYEYGATYDDYGIVKELTDEQKNKWAEKFKKYINSDFDKDKLRLVEYCYYNGCDSPDYYDSIIHEFTDDDKWMLGY